MDRRDFFKKTGGIAHTNIANKGSKRPFAGAAPYTGAWTSNEVAHLLKRCLFGAKKSDIDYFLTLSPMAAVDELLNDSTTVSPPLRDYGLIVEEDGTTYDDLGVVLGATWVNDSNTINSPLVRGQINGLRVYSLKKWWAGLIVNQGRSIKEKMVLFWHHHFSIQESEVEDAGYLYRHHNLLRTHALGSFKTLAREVTIDPAMLKHLNGYLNAKQAPDENYAREFQELFTVGKGNDSLYTENDVIAMARVLTGWRIVSNPLNSVFDVTAHDTGTKTFSAFYNNTTIAGSSLPDVELDALVNMIFATTEAARFICRKLYKWFVYYNIDDQIETEMIIPMADALIANNFQVKSALELLLKSEHFYEVAHQASYIKSPYDFIVGTMREFNIPFPAYTDYVAGYPVFAAIYQKATEMQQQLFQPPDVSGWPAYYQEPMHYELWVNSNSLPKRADFTDSLVEDALIDLRAYASYSANPADPNQLVSDVTALLLRYPLSATAKLYVKTNFLLNNSTDDTIWTNAWNSNNNTLINDSLKKMFRFLMNLPEFHLC